MIRLVRRPLIPGEFDAERWVPGICAAAALAGWGFFKLGLTTPGCLFRKLTGLPCLACGGTRCARSLAGLDLASAFGFSPLVALLFLTLAAWSLWAVLTRLRGDPLRVRLMTDARGAAQLRWAAALALALHWIWLWRNLPA